MPPKTNITNVVHTLLDGLHSISKSETIIGDPYTLGAATLVPVHRIRVGLGAGTLSGGANKDATSGESGGQGAGGAVQIEPVAVIAVGSDGIPRIMSVESEDALDDLLKQLPDGVTKTIKLLSERVGPLVEKFANRNADKNAPAAVTAPASTEALPEGSTPLLAK